MLTLPYFARSGQSRALLALALGLTLLSIFAVPAGAMVFDSSFGNGGSTFAVNNKNSKFADARAVAQRPGGGWVVVGEADADPDWEGDQRWTIAAFKANGKIDRSFGTDGRIQAFNPGGFQNSDSAADAVAVQPDGKILVAGQVDVATGRDADEYDAAVGGDPECMCLAMRAGWLIARYKPNGKLDKSFGRRGTKLISGITKSWTENGFLSSIADIAVQRNGKIAILGRTEYLANGLMASNEISRLLIYRLRRDGSIDSSFGTKGRVLKRISSKGTNFIPIRLAIMADGKYLAAGSAWRRDDKTDEDVGYFAATRLTSSGRVDATYGTSGFRLYKLGDLGGSTRDAEFFSDGSVAFAGSRYLKPADDDPRPAAATLAKFDAAGDLDANFGTSGELDLTTTLGPGYTGFEESILATRSGGVIGFVRKGEGPLEYVAAGFGPYASRLPLTLGRMNLNGVSIVRAFESERGIVIAGDYATSNRARIFLGSIVP